MTRLHLVRIWRDWSVLFIFLFAGVAIAPTVFGGGPGYASRVIAVTQILTFLSAILAMNWSYYERENLWIVLTAGGRARAYFRGLLLGRAAIGLGVSLVFLAILSVSIGVRIPVGEFALPVAAPIVAAIAAAALLTRLKLKPSAFSPPILGLLLAVQLAGVPGRAGGPAGGRPLGRDLPRAGGGLPGGRLRGLRRGDPRVRAVERLAPRGGLPPLIR